MMIGAKGPDRTWRAADDCTRLAVPNTAASIRPGSDIQGILQSGRYRAVIFGRDDQHCVSNLDALAERSPLRGRSAGLEILVVKRQLSDLDGFELPRRRSASDIIAFASIPLYEALRRLPTSTHTLTGFSMVIPLPSLEI
jgi:hypothetical protein